MATPAKKGRASHDVKATVAPGTVVCLNYRHKHAGTNMVSIDNALRALPFMPRGLLPDQLAPRLQLHLTRPPQPNTSAAEDNS